MKAAYAVLTIVVMSAAARGRHLMSEQPSGALAKCLAVLARDNTVVLTLASCGYLDFADNWIAHVEALGISNWLTVAQDAAALQYLSERQAQSASMSTPSPQAPMQMTCWQKGCRLHTSHRESITRDSSSQPINKPAGSSCYSEMHMCRYPGHVLPVSDFTGETLGDGSDLLEWGTSAFSVMACKRPLYLQVRQRPQCSHRMVWADIDGPRHAHQHAMRHCAILGSMHDCSCSCVYPSSDRILLGLKCTPCARPECRVLALALQAVLDLGYSVIWSDMDAVWLRDFQTLAPSRLDVVLVDDSESEEERRSDNTGTGTGLPSYMDPAPMITAAVGCDCGQQCRPLLLRTSSRFLPRQVARAS